MNKVLVITSVIVAGLAILGAVLSVALTSGRMEEQLEHIHWRLDKIDRQVELILGWPN